MTSSLPPLTQALTGALGGACANVLTYPLDLACARLQTQSPSSRRRGIPGAIAILRERARKNGWAALYDGLESDTSATLLSNFFYFYVYSLLRSLALRRRGAHIVSKSSPQPNQTLSVPLELALGFIAGVSSRALSTPLSVVTVRLQTEGHDDEEEVSSSPASAKTKSSRTSSVRLLQRIYEDDGIAGLWKGFASAIPLSLNPALTFAFFQLIRRMLAQLSSRPGATPTAKPAPLEAFFGAAVSNSLAVMILYPLILAKTRIQASGGRKDSDSALEALLRVLRRAAATGPVGLYQGLSAQLVKGFVSQGVSFLVKERIEQALLLVLASAAKRAA